MSKLGFGRFKAYKKSGAMLYVPDRIYEDGSFPFDDGEIVKIRIEEGRLIQESAQWWELLDWSKLPDAYAKLPKEIKDAIDNQKMAESRG